MKTKELIRLLQEADPSGEEDVCIDNEDIHFVELNEAYWDGCLQVLTRDESTEYYNVIGAKYTSKGFKINLRTLSIEEAMLNDPELPVVVEDTFVNKQMQNTVDRWRDEARKIIKEVDSLKKDEQGH